MMLSKSIVENHHLLITENFNFSFDVKRDDLIHPIISGNKWRKLEFNLLKAKELKKDGIITFGGAFSNHLVATAKAAQLEGLAAVGIVRGDELSFDSNPTLKACHDFGMQLKFVSRTEYRLKEEEFYLENLATQYPNHWIVPEGGMNYYGVIGCQKILQETQNNYDHIYLAGGTGTTATGILTSIPEKTTVHLISALKGDFLKNNISKLLLHLFLEQDIVDEYLQQLKIIDSNHFGKYGTVTDELIGFINRIYFKIGLKLDPIYTAKAFFHLIQDVKSGRIKSNERVLFIHTGGLQGGLSWKNSIEYIQS